MTYAKTPTSDEVAGLLVRLRKCAAYAEYPAEAATINEAADALQSIIADKESGEIARGPCTKFIADPCGSAKCAACGKRRAEHPSQKAST